MEGNLQDPWSHIYKSRSRIDCWVARAYQNKTAADFLREKIEPAVNDFTDSSLHHRLEIMPVFLMLMGYSFENLFKALMILSGKNAVIEGKQQGCHQLNKDFGQHNLLKLASDSGYSVVTEKELLQRVASFTVWAGRYPIPKFSHSGRPHYDGVHLEKSDLQNLPNLYESIVEELLDRVPDGEMKVGVLLSLHRTDEAIAHHQRCSPH